MDWFLSFSVNQLEGFQQLTAVSNEEKTNHYLYYKAIYIVFTWRLEAEKSNVKLSNYCRPERLTHWPDLLCPGSQRMKQTLILIFCWLFTGLARSYKRLGRTELIVRFKYLLCSQCSPLNVSFLHSVLLSDFILTETRKLPPAPGRKKRFFIIILLKPFVRWREKHLADVTRTLQKPWSSTARISNLL